jgi:cytochrome c oxidase cbb3-type subunit 3
MSSLFRIRVLALVALAALAGCDKQADNAPPAGAGVPAQRDVALVPAGGSLATAPNPLARPYYNSASAVVEGMRIYNDMNCVGCHFNGGGGIGPPLMDDQWVYGGRLDQIYDTVYFGRANGMPAWGGKLTDDQIWKVAAYVRSMSLPETIARNGSGTPSQHPAPVSQAADSIDGWHMPKGTGGTAGLPLGGTAG